MMAASFARGQAESPVIRDIRVTGAKKISPAVILSRMNSRKGAPFRDAVFRNDLKNILKLYADKLYFLATADSVRKTYSSDSSGLNLEIFISEHKPVRVDSLVISGSESVHPDWLNSHMETAAGMDFDPDILHRDIEVLIMHFENRGYPFVSVRITRFSVHEAQDIPTAVLSLDISEGPFVRLVKIDFTGQKQTQPGALGRAARIRLPSAFRQTMVDQSLIEIRKLPFIENVRGPEILRYDDTSYGLRYEITEGLSNRFDGIAGYVPKGTNAGESGYFTGMIQLSFMNLFGSARKLDAFWQKKNRYSQEFLLAYTEPWVLNYPAEAGIFIQQVVQDTTYVLREYGISTRTRVFLNAALLAGIKRKTIDPSGPVKSFVFNIPYSAFWTGYLGFEWDSRDDRINARTGAYYRAGADYNRLKECSYAESESGKDTLWIGGYARTFTVQKQFISTQKIGMDAEWYIPLYRRWVLFEGLHGMYYKTPRDVVPYSEQFLIGGLKTVRGYIQDQFSGSRTAWNNLELRWITSRDSRLFLFFDAGYYFRKEYTSSERTRIRKVSGYPAGYGFGIRFKTKIGLFGMDYGLGKNDGFSDGKIHFGITNQF